MSTATSIPQTRTAVRRLRDLRPASYNPRTITERAKAGLAASIRQWGLVQPLVINERTGNVVGGHQRLDALIAGGVEEALVVLVDLPDGEERLLNVTLNNPGIAGTFTDDLSAILDDAAAFDRGLFDSVLLSDLYPADVAVKLGRGDVEDVPAVPVTPTTRVGDLWECGDHRVLCGDSTSAADIARLCDGERARLLVTDPPYNVAYEGAAGSILGDAQEDGAFHAFLLAFYQAAIANVVEGGCIYAFHADSEGVNFRTAMTEAGWLLKQVIIWVKSSATLSRQDYNWQHEPALYGWRPGAGHYFAQDFTQTTVWQHDKPARSELHPTMKPVDLFERCLQNSSEVGDSVLDPFGGSGTTMIACERLRRRARLNELDPRFVDVVVKRWEDFTGRTATLAGTTATFAEVARDRKESGRG